MNFADKFYEKILYGNSSFCRIKLRFVMFMNAGFMIMN